MKKVCFFILINVAVNSCIFCQSTFFTFTEGWRDLAAFEYDGYYVSIGLGFTGTFQNHLQFTKLDKQGNILDEWIFKLDSTNTTEFSFQQAITTDLNDNRIIVGTITYPSAPLTSIAARFVFNNDFTEYVGGHWIYSSLDSPTQFRVSYHKGNDRFIHVADYNHNGNVHSMILETDVEGNVIWEENYTCGITICNMEARHIYTAHNGGYVFTSNEERGLTEGGIVGELDVGTIIKTDSLGVQEWRIHPGGVGEPYDSGYILLQPTDDGNYLCAWVDNFWRTSDGTTFDHYNRNPNVAIWFAKIAPDGSKLWEKNIQEEMELWDVEDIYYTMQQMIRLPDNNFVILYQDGIVKINQEAEVIWARRLNPIGFESSDEQIFYYDMKGISHTTDGGLIITGEFVAFAGTVYPEYLQTGFVLKLDEYGCYEADCHLDDPVSVVSPELSIKAMTIYPNPAKESITLSYDIGQSASRISLAVTDVAGRMVHEQALTGIVGSVQINTHEWASGMYLCRVLVDGYVGGVQRVVIAR